MSNNRQRDEPNGSASPPEDAFAPTEALDAIVIASVARQVQAREASAAAIQADIDDGRTMPMTSEQVAATLKSLGVDASDMGPELAPRRQTQVESSASVARALADADTTVNGQYELPNTAHRPVAQTVPEQAIPATRPDVGYAVTQAQGQPEGTSTGLLAAIIIVAAMIVAGLAFVIVLAMR